jgi:CxxC motif-containing protein
MSNTLGLCPTYLKTLLAPLEFSLQVSAPIIIETDNIADIKGENRGKVEPNGYEDTHRTTKIGIKGPDQFIDKVEKNETFDENQETEVFIYRVNAVSIMAPISVEGLVVKAVIDTGAIIETALFHFFLPCQ